jgi:hypothetical protein
MMFIHWRREPRASTPPLRGDAQHERREACHFSVPPERSAAKSKGQTMDSSHEETV